MTETVLPDVLSEVRGQVGFITLNRPRALNALSLGMVRDLQAGREFAITPDGPRGPAGVAQGGVLLASARATARLVALLPLGTLAMASGLGASPWSFLVDSPVGAACLLAGVGLVVGGLAWIDRIAGSVEGR